MDIGKTIKLIIVIVFAIFFIFFYLNYNPSNENLFPKCPFLLLTGYKCPGCGSQRAIHYLLNLNFNDAIRENIILVISIPYLLIGFVFETIKGKTTSILNWRRLLFGENAIYIIITIIIAFGIIRNIV